MRSRLLALLAAAVVATVLACYGSKASRNDQWTDGAVTASIRDLRPHLNAHGDEDGVVFRLVMSNHSSADYRVESASRLTVFMRRSGALSRADGAVFQVPLFVPAGQSTDTELFISTTILQTMRSTRDVAYQKPISVSDLAEIVPQPARQGRAKLANASRLMGSIDETTLTPDERTEYNRLKSEILGRATTLPHTIHDEAAVQLPIELIGLAIYDSSMRYRIDVAKRW